MKRQNIKLSVCALLLCSVFVYFEYSKSRVNGVTVLVSTPQLQSVRIGARSEL